MHYLLLGIGVWVKKPTRAYCQRSWLNLWIKNIRYWLVDTVHLKDVYNGLRPAVCGGYFFARQVLLIGKFPPFLGFNIHGVFTGIVAADYYKWYIDFSCEEMGNFHHILIIGSLVSKCKLQSKPGFSRCFT